MNRRDFLALIGGGVAAAAMPEVAFTEVLGNRYRRLLVLVELKGGNDGLNTVVPYTDPLYYQLRPRLAIPRDKVLPLDQRLGFHPDLVSLMPAWQAGEVALVQGVGYPAPNLSHFRSIEIWDTASASDQYLTDGWLARAFKHHPPPADYAADGVVLGSNDLGPFTGGARTIVLKDQKRIQPIHGNRRPLVAMPANSALAHIQQVEGDIENAAGRLSFATQLKTEFPRSAIGNQLKTVAEAVAGNSGVAVARVTLAGFDTHRDQLATQARLLRQFADALTAFRVSMQELSRWNDTLVLTYAEFGRRVAENDSGGTDHGTANVHFALGGRVKGGLHGKPPQLDNLNDGNLIHGVDYRQLYATVIDRWWGMPSTDILGGRFTPLDILRA